jgi:uncharacterized protein (TIGR01777 family)
MRVLFTGATGLIGKAVVQALIARGDEVLALTRNVQRARRTLGADVELHEWPEPKRDRPPMDALERADAVVNLLGEPIAQRWTDSAKREIHDSRVLGTRALVAALVGLPAGKRPATLVSESASGYYGAQEDERFDEFAEPGTDFLARLTVEWEGAALAASESMRVVVTRMGVVLDRHAGALAKMLLPFRLGLGGPVAGGEQYVPWVHLADAVGGLLEVIDDEAATGPVNVNAPKAVTNRELSRTLGAVLGRPAVLPVPGFAMKLLFGEMASVVVTGQRPIPRRLLELGYEFRYPELEPALRDLLSG